jgi:hypothetical protein
MTASEEHAAFLRAYLQGDEDAVTSSWGQATSPDGLALLVHAAFVIAARRKFAPTWTRAAVVRYVAEVREALSERPDLIDPRIAEYELRRALGDKTPPTASPSSVATAQLIMLNAMIASLDLDGAGVDELLRQAL